MKDYGVFVHVCLYGRNIGDDAGSPRRLNVEIRLELQIRPGQVGLLKLAGLFEDMCDEPSDKTVT